MSTTLNINDSNGIFVNFGDNLASITSDISIVFGGVRDSSGNTITIPNNLNFKFRNTNSIEYTYVTLDGSAHIVSPGTYEFICNLNDTSYVFRKIVINGAEYYSNNITVTLDNSVTIYLIIDNKVNVSFISGDGMPDIEPWFSFMLTDGNNGGQSYSGAHGQYADYISDLNSPLTLSNFNLSALNGKTLQYRHYFGNNEAGQFINAGNSISINSGTRNSTVEFRAVESYSLTIISNTIGVTVSCSVDFRNINSISQTSNYSNINSSVGITIDGIQPLTDLSIYNFSASTGYNVVAYKKGVNGVPEDISDDTITIESISDNLIVYLISTQQIIEHTVTIKNTSIEAEVSFTCNGNEYYLNTEGQTSINVNHGSDITLSHILAITTGYEVLEYFINDGTSQQIEGNTIVCNNITDDTTINLKVAQTSLTQTCQVTLQTNGAIVKYRINNDSIIQYSSPITIEQGSTFKIQKITYPNGNRFNRWEKIIDSSVSAIIDQENFEDTINENCTFNLILENNNVYNPTSEIRCHIKTSNLNINQYEHVKIEIMNADISDPAITLNDDPAQTITVTSNNFTSLENDYQIIKNKYFYICIHPCGSNGSNPDMIANNAKLKIYYEKECENCEIEEIENENYFYKLSCRFTDNVPFGQLSSLLITVNYISTDVARYYKIRNVYTNLLNNNEQNYIKNQINTNKPYSTPITINFSQLYNRGYIYNFAKCCWVSDMTTIKECECSVENGICSFTLVEFDDESPVTSPTLIDVYFNFTGGNLLKYETLISNSYIKEPEYSIELKYAQSIQNVEIQWKPTIYMQ